MLHAKEISFKHPRDGRMMHFEVDASKEFYEILQKYED